MNIESLDAGLVRVLRRLISLSTLDLPYADEYLRRGEMLLPRLCPREQYLQIQHDRENLVRLSEQIRQATNQADWPRVGKLAHEAEEAGKRIAASESVRQLADAIYGPRVLRADATALALTGVVLHPIADLGSVRAAIMDQLQFLVTNDPQWAAFYRARLSHFERLRLIDGEVPAAAVDSSALQTEILQAVERADFSHVERLAGAIVTQINGRPGPLRQSWPRRASAELAAAVPVQDDSCAQGLGLMPQTLEAASSFGEYLSGSCIEPPTLPASPLRVETAGAGIGMRTSLRENLELLLLHPFVTSAGTRYLPWFGPEALLVETFPETEPDARTALLGALGLRGRRGLSRVVIENAIRTHGAQVCTALGLDPAQFVVTCIPFDVYVRLAPQYGWGQRELWTHFDGYQLTRELHLRALVGGDVRYGGADDLCSVEREYDVDGLVARFALLRRRRFIGGEPGEP